MICDDISILSDADRRTIIEGTERNLSKVRSDINRLRIKQSLLEQEGSNTNYERNRLKALESIEYRIYHYLMRQKGLER